MRFHIISATMLVVSIVVFSLAFIYARCYCTPLTKEQTALVNAYKQMPENVRNDYYFASPLSVEQINQIAEYGKTLKSYNSLPEIARTVLTTTNNLCGLSVGVAISGERATAILPMLLKEDASIAPDAEKADIKVSETVSCNIMYGKRLWISYAGVEYIYPEPWTCDESSEIKQFVHKFALDVAHSRHNKIAKTAIQ